MNTALDMGRVTERPGGRYLANGGTIGYAFAARWDTAGGGNWWPLPDCVCTGEAWGIWF